MTTHEVIDGKGVVHHLAADRLRPLAAVERGASELRSLACLLKLADHLARPDTLTAHLSPTLLPLPHQISHVQTALNSPTTRLLIADEVGLGKTISAGLIIKELLERWRFARPDPVTCRTRRSVDPGVADTLPARSDTALHGPLTHTKRVSRLERT